MEQPEHALQYEAEMLNRTTKFFTPRKSKIRGTSYD